MFATSKGIEKGPLFALEIHLQIWDLILFCRITEVYNWKANE